MPIENIKGLKLQLETQLLRKSEVLDETYVFCVVTGACYCLRLTGKIAKVEGR